MGKVSKLSMTAVKPANHISQEAYVDLEGRLTDLRFRIMRLATQDARAQQAPVVTIEHVRQALAKFVSGGLDLSVPEGPAVGNFPDAPYQYLTRRLLTLHMVLTGWAVKFAQDEHAREGTDIDVVIMPQHIELAWREAGTPSRLQATLLLGDPSVGQSE
jgi:hypothetical protein